MKLLTWSVVSLWSVSGHMIISVCFRTLLLLVHEMFTMQMSHSLYWDVHQSCSHLQTGAGICSVPTADTVATDKVSCNNFIVQVRSLPWFAEMTSQEYCSAVQWPMACKDVTSNTKTWIFLFYIVTDQYVPSMCLMSKSKLVLMPGLDL